MTQVWDSRPIFIEGANAEEQLFVRGSGAERYDVVPTLQHFPSGIRGAAAHVGVAADPTVLDFSVVRLPRACTAAAVYTRNLCVSPAIVFDRENTTRGEIQLVCVVSKNANVFTPNGLADVRTLAQALSQEFDVKTEEILISCTGVIGRELPIARIVSNVPGIAARVTEQGVEQVSRAILTTDKRAKCASIRLGDVVIAGYAKGAGMIEPNMATMLVYLYTNAQVEKAALDRALKRAVDPTFNSMSVDTDTSTSDTVALMATGEVPLKDAELFELGLTAICLQLARAVAREAEGATKLLEVSVGLASSEADAAFFAKKIVNSPLIKTAIHGADPNWGRVVMAIGKPSPGSPLLTFEREDVVIAIQGQTLFDRGRALSVDLNGLSKSIREAETVHIDVTIGVAAYSAKVWGCDLSAEYVNENAHYTT